METESELEPWEGLDIDDSDISTFLRPCKRHHSNYSLIPGPAGALQAAMIHRRAQTSPEDDPLPTQEFLRRVVQNGHETDLDFNSNPWLSALEFVHPPPPPPPPQGVVDDDDVVTPLSSIKKHLHAGRVPKVVAVIKSCTPNGFGDMMVTLKDPTTTIGASIHRKVFKEGEFGKDITAGSVLVLQKVAVFSPTPSTCYLNVTLRNIIKVFSKESGPPSQQIYPASSGRRPSPNIERHEKSWMLGSTFSLPQERTEGIMTDLRLDSRFREVADIGKQRGETLVLTNSHSDHDGNDKTQRSVSDKENLSVSRHESEMEDQANPPKLGEGDKLTWTAQGNSSSTNSVHISDGQETGIKNHLERQTEVVNPKSSIPHWTEEQLNELLAFD
ncbi:uncharacterized protein LOC133299240 [Gastrolobium bilobum]|uniref:uncharacterized protein LOC133299240 n=1 Tax=Gastrolobium bilobum TaxID=150636 RepID=UPI002AB298AA|nr:uncharacterized protein LOC133299240 [Gastrolobium bilobum]